MESMLFDRMENSRNVNKSQNNGVKKTRSYKKDANAFTDLLQRQADSKTKQKTKYNEINNRKHKTFERKQNGTLVEENKNVNISEKNKRKRIDKHEKREVDNGGSSVKDEEIKDDILMQDMQHAVEYLEQLNEDINLVNKAENIKDEEIMQQIEQILENFGQFINENSVDNEQNGTVKNIEEIMQQIEQILENFGQFINVNKTSVDNKMKDIKVKEMLLDVEQGLENFGQSMDKINFINRDSKIQNMAENISELKEDIEQFQTIVETAKNNDSILNELKDAEKQKVTISESNIENVDIINSENDTNETYIQSNDNGYIIEFDNKEEYTIVPAKGEKIIFTKEEIVNNVAEKIGIKYNGEQSEIVIKLKPEILGKMSLKITVEDGIASVNAAVETYKVKELLESNFSQLKEELEKQGLDIQNFSVSVNKDSSFQENQSRRWNNKKSNKKSNNYELQNSGKENSYEYVSTERLYLNKNGGVDFMA